MKYVDHSVPNLELPTWLWWWLPLTLFVAVYGLQFLGSTLYMRFVLSEYGLVENLTVIFLLFAVSIGACMLFQRCFPDRLFGFWIAMLTVGCLYFAGEEVSWGQHLFRWETPEAWARVNYQQETNLHNTVPFLDEAPRMFLTIGALVGGVVIPLLRWRHPEPRNKLWNATRLYSGTLVCAPAAILAITVSLPTKLATALGFAAPQLLRNASGECKELFLALTLMLYFLSLQQRIGETSDADVVFRPFANDNDSVPTLRRAA